SPSGKLLHSWITGYASTLAFGPNGFLYANGGLNAGGDMVRLDPATGHVLKLFHRPLGFTYDALAGAPGPGVYIGATTSLDAPFAVEKLQPNGSFKDLNDDQESVAGLAVDSNGTIFVVRSSYAEPGAAGGTGLFELSATGSNVGKFAFCK
ncbi:MAG TPA: hypothetical protein VG815_19435, partial [Chloroflexota bacterium]|nr:hypothetical protein [Chloroflexota bacterium]